MEKQKAVLIEEVSKKYHNHVALDKVSFEIEEGSIFGLLGPNGAGKTSLIRMITQITQPDSGTIRFFGELLKQEHLKEIGYLPEERGLYRNMKVGEQLIYFGQLRGLSEKVLKKELKAWLEKLEMMEWWNKKTSELSKGMQQKLQFVATVLHRPKFIILDEPFSGFDPVNALIIKNEIIELNNKGATILFSTHRMENAEEICDEIALINHSKLVLNGKTTAIKSKNRTTSYSLEAFGECDAEKISEIGGVELIQKSGKFSFKMKAKEGESLQTIIKKLPDYDWIKVEEEIPTLNDIFIDTVSVQK